jgi:poly(3-hydroxybutyrate) depolymerase
VRRFGCLALALAVSPAAGCRKPLASSPAPGPAICSAIRATGNAPLVDDFEKDPGRILAEEGRGGWWFSYDDGTGGRLLREEVEVSGNRALHVVASGFTRWGAGFGASLHPATTARTGCPYDASAHSGIRFRARGRGRLRIMLADATSTPAAGGGTCTRPGDRCHDRPGVWVDLEQEWKTHQYPFCTLVPEGWGGSVEGVDPSRLFAFHFRIGARENVEVWLDDLGFYRAAPGTPEPRCGVPCPLDAAPRSARIEPRFSTAPLTRELSLHTFEQVTKSCGPLVRRYLSYVPNGLGSRCSAPVLLMLHGSGANAESARTFMTHDRFDALAARDGFIVVYGNAAPSARTSPDPGFPNTGTWRQGFLDDGQVDDVDYLERVLADLEARGVIRGDNPVLLAGHSNGGGMVLEAARRIPHRLRGIAAVMPYDGEEPKPVPDLSATKLRRVLFVYTLQDPGMADRYHETLAPLPAAWAAAMGVPQSLIASPRRTPLPNAVVEGESYRGSSGAVLATRNSQVNQVDMGAPGSDGQVRVLILDHAGHFWPNPTQDTEDWALDRWGLRNQDFDAADMVWEYLRGGLPAPAPAR